MILWIFLQPTIHEMDALSLIVALLPFATGKNILVFLVSMDNLRYIVSLYANFWLSNKIPIMPQPI